MAIWQTMKGSVLKPKKGWLPADNKYQHFSESTGRPLEGDIGKGDTLVIYWPGSGNRVYMGIATALESGPYKLKKSVPGAKEWPWGLRIKRKKYIELKTDGIKLRDAKKRIKKKKGLEIPAHKGLQEADDWVGIKWLINEIEKRGK